MKLIESISPRRSEGNFHVSRGLFSCGYCKKEVELDLSNGKKAKSCGCAKDKLIGDGLRIHGDSDKRAKYHWIYSVWKDIRKRCLNPNSVRYHRYGGRGIGICDKWNSYLEFRKFALGHGARKELQIDRIDNDGDYTPENVRFVTNAVNCQNQSTTQMNWEKVKYIRELYNSKLYTQVLLARIFKVTTYIIWKIVNNKSWIKQK